YRLTTAQLPGGNGWDSADNGTYTLSLQANQVADTSGNFAAAAAVGTFTVDVDTVPPTVSAVSAPDVTNGSSLTQYDFTVTFAANTAIAVASLDGSDVLVTGPNGYSQLAGFVSVDVNSNGTPRPASQLLTAALPAGGGWDASDNGTYTLSLQANQV